MVYRPLYSFGRFVLAACAVSLGVASLGAQTTPSTTAPAGPNLSRVDVFLGYSYYGAHGMVKPEGISYSSINVGGTVSGAYYFNKYVGMEVALVAHPDGNNDSLYTGSAGPIFRAHMQNYTLFAHANAGGAYLGGPNQNDEAPVISGVPSYYEPNTWGPTLAVGGGMDYDLPFFNNRFSLRLFQADYRYVHADFGPQISSTPGTASGLLGGRANIGAAELSTGIVTHFGSIVPPPPVTYSCAVSPTTVYPGDPITATGTALNLNPKKTASYTWTADGGTVAGTSSTANIDTKSAAPGTYTVKGHVSEGNKPAEQADCTAQYTVKPFDPPTISCSASPSSLNPGDSSTITASGVSPQNRPLTYSYSSTAGSVSGTSSTATLSTAGAAPGTITVTCNVVDDKGQTASSTTTVTVAAPPVPQVLTSNLCSINFDRDKRRPTRVNNEAKACLDDIALNLQRTSDAKIAVIGNAAGDEKEGKKFASERAINTKEYLVKEKGIDASRVTVYTGSQDGKTVNTTLIPAGANFDASSYAPVDESAPKAPEHHKHHKM
ncbi:OmpA family protein [Granulicella arctica]|uniref:Outer membrane protein OmpA-like peptidoglycan-associated protein n=1 Tax=Granulicella arctica TaxID=940613 RepID=A0A7Y9PJK6_9BACT|nr:OmpA family protein [Granulicella arctica]NYF80954.1 outer membrane protein OmpA-like peptidoglycan-associated protein [Granulicella arctica]